MKKEIGIDREKLIDEMSKLPAMVLDTAYRYAINYVNYGEDVTQKWLTSIAKTRALETAYERGYYDSLRDSSNAKWVKISDQLPNDYQDVLVTTKEGYIDTGHYYGGNSWSIGEGFYYETSEILAWQPLPEPYREENEE